jgi:NAD(P)-dependent dehydrogenase (short-subunit alcohol dehydrogenase family)
MATISLKPLNEQVIVITGASSGIGLATALAAAEEGANVVLSARSSQVLRTLAEHINVAGGHAVSVVADVANADDVNQIAKVAIAEFGRIDTWVNNAGILKAATHHTRDEKVGLMATMNTLTAKFLPGIADKLSAKKVEQQQHDLPPQRDPNGALYRPSEDGRTHGTSRAAE